jgi:hypothetical protein
MRSMSRAGSRYEGPDRRGRDVASDRKLPFRSDDQSERFADSTLETKCFLDEDLIAPTSDHVVTGAFTEC